MKKKIILLDFVVIWTKNRMVQRIFNIKKKFLEGIFHFFKNKISCGSFFDLFFTHPLQQLQHLISNLNFGALQNVIQSNPFYFIFIYFLFYFLFYFYFIFIYFLFCFYFYQVNKCLILDTLILHHFVPEDCIVVRKF